VWHEKNVLQKQTAVANKSHGRIFTVVPRRAEGREEMNSSELLVTVAALNTARANALTLFLAQLFGEKKVRTDEKGTVMVSRWRGKYYLLDYVPAKDGGK
jgi:hypothetical protein